ncbi:LysR family transcriptional regulator [Streptomyces cinereoruber]|uniref:LysR family transcriptional regulator n=1 Tax=Streptomyces cinereoruber TaxID=67260 RepID=UPI0036381801
MDLLDGRLKFRHLTLLIAVYDHGSVVWAAESLHLTQPAAARTLRELEAIAEFPLFVRLPRGTRPTVYDEALVGHARVVVTEIRRAREHLTGLRRGQDGTVTVGTLLAGHPLLTEGPAGGTVALAHPWILPVEQTALRQELGALFVDRGLPLPTDRVECTSVLTMRALLLQTDMVALLPELVLRDDEHLAALPVELPSVGRTVGVTEAAHRTRPRSPPAPPRRGGGVAPREPRRRRAGVTDPGASDPRPREVRRRRQGAEGEVPVAGGPGRAERVDHCRRHVPHQR